MMAATVAAEPVESYADVAVERWHHERLLRPRRGQSRRHNPRFCCCLTCADGREATGQRPLIPLYARRPLPEVRP
jgi:hypothetical protein